MERDHYLIEALWRRSFQAGDYDFAAELCAGSGHPQASSWLQQLDTARQHRQRRRRQVRQLALAVRLGALCIVIAAIWVSVVMSQQRRELAYSLRLTEQAEAQRRQSERAAVPAFMASAWRALEREDVTAAEIALEWALRFSQMTPQSN